MNDQGEMPWQPRVSSLWSRSRLMWYGEGGADAI